MPITDVTLETNVLMSGCMLRVKKKGANMNLFRVVALPVVLGCRYYCVYITFQPHPLEIHSPLMLQFWLLYFTQWWVRLIVIIFQTSNVCIFISMYFSGRHDRQNVTDQGRLASI